MEKEILRLRGEHTHPRRVIVVVIMVIWSYMEVVKSAGMAFMSTTQMILNQTIQEMKEWLQKL